MWIVGIKEGSNQNVVDNEDYQEVRLGPGELWELNGGQVSL